MLQNFTYTSRATELGRGNKDTKMSKVPDWTPGPGAYTMPSDFINKQKEKVFCSQTNWIDNEHRITSHDPG